MKPSLLATALFLASTAALAAEPFAVELRGGASVLSGQESFRVDFVGLNDSVGPLLSPATGLNYDRWFTASHMIGMRWALPHGALRLPPDARVLLSASLGQNIYTPRTAMIATEAELQGDRPYSGWLKGSLGVDVLLPYAPLAFTHGGRPYSHLSLDLHGGAQGPWSLAGWIQFHAHNLPAVVSGQPLPTEVGWGTIETRPGLTGDVSLFAETTLASLDAPAPSWMQWSGAAPSFHWMAGFSGHAGSMLLAAAAHTSLTAGWMGDPLTPAPASLPTAAYLYLRTEVRGVGYNATIDAPILDGDVVARHEPLVGEVSFGAVARFWRLEGSVGGVYRTNEVATLPDQFRANQLIWQATVSYVQ